MSQLLNQYPLIVSVSGIRGIAGKSLTLITAYQYALAFGQNFPGKIIVGRDSRQSGRMIKNGVIQGLVDAKCKVIDLGIIATPTLQMAILYQKAAGGIMITASHNPSEWNGLKFFRDDGTFLRAKQIQKVFNKLPQIANPIINSKNRSVKKWNRAENRHLSDILKTIDSKKIKNRGFRVALDPVNGSGARIAQSLLKKLNCRVLATNLKMDGNFAHWPEPTPANLEDFSKFILGKKIDIGFALDPDADRLVVVCPDGKVVNEEYTLALVVKHYLKNIKRGGVVINQSTSRVNEDIAQSFKSRLYRTPVGEINVVDEMIKRQAVIGGEGNGGVIDPRVHFGRDALVGMALILEYLAFENQPLTALLAEIPQYENIKEKIPSSGLRFEGLVLKLKKQFAKVEYTETDGIRFFWSDRWLHIRPSNTEPIVRLIAEAPTKKEAQELVRLAKKAIK